GQQIRVSGVATETLVAAEPGQRSGVQKGNAPGQRERFSHRLVGPGGGDRARRGAPRGGGGGKGGERGGGRERHSTPSAWEMIVGEVESRLHIQLLVKDIASAGCETDHALPSNG